MTLAIVAIVVLDVAIVGVLALVMRSAARWGTTPQHEIHKQRLAARPRAAHASRPRTAAGRAIGVDA
jgi:hypothetical protein